MEVSHHDSGSEDHKNDCLYVVGLSGWFARAVVQNLKGVAIEERQVDLRKASSSIWRFERINPQGAIPALVLDDGRTLVQSMAIMEILREAIRRRHCYPPTLLTGHLYVLWLNSSGRRPPACDAPGSFYLEEELGHSESQYLAWGQHFMGAALAAMEGHLARDPQTGIFCHGDQLTLADVCLFSQVVGFAFFRWNSRRISCGRANQRQPACKWMPSSVRIRSRNPNAPRGEPRRAAYRPMSENFAQTTSGMRMRKSMAFGQTASIPSLSATNVRPS